MSLLTLTLSPRRLDQHLKLVREDDVLWLNDRKLDLTDLPEGASLPPEAVDCDFIQEPITRQDGNLHIVLVLPHGARAPTHTRFPAPMVLSENGPVDLPPYEETPDV